MKHPRLSPLSSDRPPPTAQPSRQDRKRTNFALAQAPSGMKEKHEWLHEPYTYLPPLLLTTPYSSILESRLLDEGEQREKGNELVLPPCEAISCKIEPLLHRAAGAAKSQANG